MLTSITLSATPITYQELLQSATLQSNRLKMAKSDENIENSILETIYAQYYPSFSVSYNTEHNRDMGDYLTGTQSVGDTIITSGTRYQSSLSLNLNYELYNFGTTQKSINIAKGKVNVKHLLWCEEEKKLHQEILEHYNSAVKMNTESEIKRQMFNIRQQLFETKKRLYKAGKYSKIDLGDEAITIIDIERDIERSSMRYQEDVIKLSSLSHIEMNEKTTRLLPIIYNKTAVLADEFEETTQGHRYTQQILQKQEEISMHNSSQLPKLLMYGNYYMYGSDPDDAYDSFKDVRKNSWKIGFSVRMNIFEGFKYNSESERLRYELLRIEQERDLRNREYEYDARSKSEKIVHLKALQEKDQNLLDVTQEKIGMVDRLRDNQQIDSISELSAKLEGLERELNLRIEQSEAAYEKASLDILYRGIDQCTQH